MRILLTLARLLGIVGYCGIVYAAAHYSAAAAIAVTIIWLFVFGALFQPKAPAG